MGDIESMFYQVKVPKEDSDCLRFYWWPDGDVRKEPSVYRMLVHIFGAVSSPSCAGFALRQTAEQNSQLYDKDIVATVKKSFYVDDCLASRSSVGEAKKLITDATSLVARGGFRLTKWTSNSCDVVESVQPNERAKNVRDLDLEKQHLPNERALGVHWFVETDSLGFKVQQRKCTPTRREMLSVISSVYDPLGMVAPFVLEAKLILQDLCKEGVDWDEEIQGNTLKKWQRWLSDVPLLGEVKRARCYKPPGFGKIVSCQLHHFADASEHGYGVVSYIRLENEVGKVHCSFLLGKARVAPLKQVTIPRMELTAATIAVRLSEMLRRELEYHIDNINFWSDSTSVLKYVSNDKSRFKTFVANRVTVIREATRPEQWRFVEGKSNPADSASRGRSMKKLLSNDLWFSGPEFLWSPESEWPKQTWDTNLSTDDIETKEVLACVHSTESATERLMANYSDWDKLKRVVGRLLVAKETLKRWVGETRQLRTNIEKTVSDPVVLEQKFEEEVKDMKKARIAKKTQYSTLKVETLEQAELAVFRFVQSKHFPEEMKLLCKVPEGESVRIPKSSPVRKLDPILVNGVMRVGGRLDKSGLPYETKHPVLLPKESLVVRTIVRREHRAVGHLGKNSILASLRQKYWILGASAVIKSVVSKCVICRRYQGPLMLQKMSNLPVDRVQPDEPPFTCTGMDFFGPFEVKRGRSTVKRYGVIFTCLAIRAVHIEMDSSLDTDACINAIRRFLARRGQVRVIRSDNGTNLVAAERELREEIAKWNIQQIDNVMVQHSVSWEFNPPSGSHFGGVWERLIRLVRKVLHSLMKEQNICLDDDSLNTLFCEVESILNGRPLTEAPNSPHDLEVLTPNHLLLLRSGAGVPPGLFLKSDSYARRRWRQVQYLADIFWKRWVREYLPLLQSRQKWLDPVKNVSVGDIVLIADNTPRNAWALARVLEVMADKRGLVRMVKLKTKNTTLVRPVAKLCMMLEGQGDK